MYRLGIAAAVLAACGACAPMVTVYSSSDTLVREIRVTKEAVCVGEPLRVEVSTDANADAQVFVDGFAGTPHLLHYLHPGERKVAVAASATGVPIDRHEFEVTIEECETDWIVVHHAPDPFSPYGVQFWLESSMDFPEGASFHWAFGDGGSATTDRPYAHHSYAASVSHDVPYTTLTMAVQESVSGLAAGDTVSLRSHIHHSRELGELETLVECGLTYEPKSGETTETGPTTPQVPDVVGPGTSLPTPPTLTIPLDAVQTSEDAVFTIVVTNPHPEAIVFDRFRTSHRACAADGPMHWEDVSAYDLFGESQIDQLSAWGYPYDPVIGGNPITGQPSPTPQTAGELVVPTKESLSGEVRDDAAGLPDWACVLGIHLIGRGQSTDLPAYGSCYLRTHAPDEQEVDEETRALFGALYEAQLIPEGAEVTTEELFRLRGEGRIVWTPEGWEVAP